MPQEFRTPEKSDVFKDRLGSFRPYFLVIGAAIYSFFEIGTTFIAVLCVAVFIDALDEITLRICAAIREKK